MAKPICKHCGNDGTTSGLFVTVDARWDGTNWVLEPRDDEGGRSIDCLACDERTEESETDPFFPYGEFPLEPLQAWRALT